MTEKPEPSRTKKSKPPASTNWGIPNWRDPSSYGDTKRWSEARWHWEFMRRREDCRADFLAYKDEEERDPPAELAGPRRGAKARRPPAATR